MLTSVTAFVAAATLIVLLPGPDTLVVMRSLLRGGRRGAVVTAAGVLCGLAVWVVAASLGLSALLRASRDGYAALRYAGAVYLVWLGVQSFRSRTAPRGAEPAGVPPAAPSEGAPQPAGRRNGFGAGLATDLLNPKVGVFFVTFLPGFVPRGYDVGSTTLLLGAIFIAEAAAYFALLLLLAGRITRWWRNARIRRRLDRATGLVLIGFGLRLAVER